MLIQLIDGGIKEIQYDRDNWSGCETCDYGSSYINEFTVYLTNGFVHIKVSKMYDFAVSEDFLMKLFLQNVDTIKTLTESEFKKWIEEKVRNELLEKKHRYDHLKVDVKSYQ